MADADSDVDISPPTTPSRTSSTFPPLTSTPTQRSRTLRFADIYSSQHPTYDPEAPYSPGDPFIAFEKIKEIKVNGNISKATEKVFDKEREVIAKSEQIAEEYSRALHEVTSCVQELGLGNDIGQLEKALAQVPKRFARGDNLTGIGTYHTGLSQSIHATSQGTASSSKTSYAEATKSHLPNISRAILPQKPRKPAPNHTPSVRKNDNRIFVRLPETHASQNHHIHAVKAALRSKLGPEGGSVKAIQKVKSGIAIVSIDGKHAEKLLEKAQMITSVLGGKVEKAVEWVAYVIDHVPRKIYSLDGKEIEITEGLAKEEAEATTGQIPTKISWSRKTLANPAPTGTIVASFKNHTHASRLFGTSSLARKVIKSPKPTQCPKYWGYHDARLYNYEQRCKQFNVTGHSSCKNPPRCINCKGPHIADEIHCPARPLVRNDTIVSLSQVQLKKIRQAGHKAWLSANPVNPEVIEENNATQCLLVS